MHIIDHVQQYLHDFHWRKLGFTNYLTIVLTIVTLAMAVRSLFRWLIGRSAGVYPGQEDTIGLASPCTANYTTQKLRTYDYIIAGGGTAGCVLANRLTEDPSVTVLMIEAGHSDLRQVFSKIPAGGPMLFGTLADWGLNTIPQKQANGRKLYWPRGRMLGGSSSINAQMYQRGAPDDYNEWESKYGCTGWGWKDVVPYFNKSETRTPSEKWKVDSSSEQGRDGPWQIGYRELHHTSKDFMDAAEAQGIVKVQDVNTSKGPIGVSAVPTFIDKKGQRSSTAVAYLPEKVFQRPNLAIATGQTVTKVLFEQVDGETRATSVEMANHKDSIIRYRAAARKEILICLGAVSSPHLLKVSGIGPAQELTVHGIDVVNELNQVGENLQDHHQAALIAYAQKSTSMQRLQNQLAILPYVLQWFISGQGPLSSNIADVYAFLKLKDLRPDFPDETSGPNSPDLELIHLPVALKDHGRFKDYSKGYLSTSVVALRPISKGNITIKSKDIFDKPNIDPKTLERKQDLEAMVIGLRKAKAVMESEPYSKHITGWFEKPDSETDAAYRKFVREHIETLYHPACSVKMGRKEDGAVLDPRLRVYGVSNLRVVDASVMPRIVASHTCAPTVMIAEKAADMIKEDSMKQGF